MRPFTPRPTTPDDRTPPHPLTAADWAAVRKVHLMGICGSAMGALASLLKRSGYEVRGSDASPYPPMSDFLAAREIPVMRGYEADNLDWDPDLVVVGNVIRPAYPEAIAMRARGLPHTSMAGALAGLFLEGRIPVVVTGTHGKTTTASMTAWLLEVAGLRPTFFIGGVAGNWQSNHHLGDGPFVVVEGDEYDTAYWDKGAKFLHYRPHLASINNLEMDHADIFPDVDAIERTFTRFASLLPADGTPAPRLVVPASEARAMRAAGASRAPLWTTAIDADADLRATDLDLQPESTRFALHLPGHAPLAVTLPAPGLHNVKNALVAAGLALAAGAAPAAIAEGLGTFRLPHKRLTLRGEARGIPVIDDFAHHPTAIAATIDAVRQRYPGRRLVALFEAQSNTARRRVFQDGFGAALAKADRVWFCKPLDKASDPLPAEERLDLTALCASLNHHSITATIVPEVADLAATVIAEARDGDVLLVMSGRDFGGIHALLLAGLGA
jgi:UDP-N-acetylmuramate: L-alanyl-gamma-D-glutamyl-meso-diaminopimelate ligase